MHDLSKREMRALKYLPSFSYLFTRAKERNTSVCGYAYLECKSNSRGHTGADPRVDIRFSLILSDSRLILASQTTFTEIKTALSASHPRLPSNAAERLDEPSAITETDVRNKFLFFGRLRQATDDACG